MLHEASRRTQLEGVHVALRNVFSKIHKLRAITGNVADSIERDAVVPPASCISTLVVIPRGLREDRPDNEAVDVVLEKLACSRMIGVESDKSRFSEVPAIPA